MAPSAYAQYRHVKHLAIQARRDTHAGSGQNKFNNLKPLQCLSLNSLAVDLEYANSDQFLRSAFFEWTVTQPILVMLSIQRATNLDKFANARICSAVDSIVYADLGMSCSCSRLPHKPQCRAVFHISSTFTLPKRNAE